MKNLLYKILAAWTLIVFALGLTLTALFCFITGWMSEPGKTEIFRKFSVGWIRSFLFFTGCRLNVKGTENFKKGELYIVTANHNSFIDVPLLTPFIPWANKTIAKAEMAKIPIFGVVYKRGSILVNRKDPESRKHSFLDMKRVLEKGMYMCVYPEGTRNRTELPLKEFHDGAFRLAMETHKSIIPALLFNTKKALPMNKGFYFKPQRFELHFLPGISPDRFPDSHALKAEVYKVMTEYYSTQSKLLNKTIQ